MTSRPGGGEAVARLQVARARDGDAGRGTARLGAGALAALGLEAGMLIEVRGSDLTAARVLEAPREDEALDLVRLDGMQRLNAGVGIGDFVDVRRVDPPEARRVRLVPLGDEGAWERPVSAAWLARALVGWPLAPRDVVSTAGLGRRTGRPDDPDATRRGPNGGRASPYTLSERRLMVVLTDPDGIVVVGADTDVEVAGEEARRGAAGGVEAASAGRGRADGVTYDDVGGLAPALQEIREIVELPFRHPEVFLGLGIAPPRGVLLYGPPGTGKTLLARAVANEAVASFHYIAAPEIMGRYYGEAEGRLRGVFDEAARDAPAIVFIDEIDAIAARRDEAGGDVERRVVAQLLSLMDGLESPDRVVVIAATNRVDAIDEALRRPGRFDREIAVGPPDRRGRAEVLRIHTRGMPLEGVDLDEVARVTHGFVGADLTALVREAAMESVRRALGAEPPGPADGIGYAGDHDDLARVLSTIRVGAEDFRTALARVGPSAMREIRLEITDVGWEDIGGLGDVKDALREGIEIPLRHPEAFRRLGIRAPKGFLLFGPPGTGKTLLARAVAHEAEANFISVKASELLSKWYGESERQVTRVFARARQVAPAVVFLDEIDALAPVRRDRAGEPAVTERVVDTLLSEMDGLEELHGVVVLAATNQPTLLDPALLRPGRFDEILYVPVPDRDARARILRVHTRETPLGDDVDLDRLADATEGFTGADLEALVRRAGLLALREDLEIPRIDMRFFAAALESMGPSVTEEVKAEYARLARRLREDAARARARIGFAGDS